MKSLSDKQKNILNYIEQYSLEHGFPPAVREICRAVGLSSPSTVHTHINTLCEKGYLSRDTRKPRSLIVTGSKRPVLPQIPLLGSVAAGSPILAEENIESYVSFDVNASNADYFALKIRGNSMIDAGIFDGDTVIVKSVPVARHNDIVIALIDDEATCKRLYMKNNEILLMPENADYSPIDGKECSILGIVTGLMRSY